MWVAVSTASRSVLAASAPPNKLMQVSTTPWPKCRGVFVCAVQVFLGLAFLTACAQESPSAAVDCAQMDAETRALAERVRLDRVVDGDTLKLEDGRKVRVLAINTPEMHPEKRKPDAFAVEATDAVEAFFSQKSLLLVPGSDSRDSYGRTLAYVYNLKGQNLSAYLVAQGLAWHIAVPPNLKLASCLSTIEERARQANLRLWNLPSTPSDKVNSGGFQRIVGRIQSISFGKPGKPWWITLDGNLTAVVYPENQHYFDSALLVSLESALLEGAMVEIRGWVYSDRQKRGHWRVKLEAPYSIYLPSP